MYTIYLYKPSIFSPTGYGKIILLMLFIAVMFPGSGITANPSGKGSRQLFEPVPADNYVSANQYKIDIIHYLINIDLYPEQKMLKGDVVITGVLLDKNIPQIDLNFYDNMKISGLQLNGRPAAYTEKGTRLSVPLSGSQPDTFNIQVLYEGT
ncbi:MAG: hypothetical protein P4L45_07780, partial [Ignavibacteriaceae bacterium]|nr:hypothetical protein [Ignavibacteriaceae bacterium]